MNRDREGEMAASAERRRKALMTESGEVQWGDGFWDYAINIKHYIYIYVHMYNIHIQHTYINVYIYILYHIHTHTQHYIYLYTQH